VRREAGLRVDLSLVGFAEAQADALQLELRPLEDKSTGFAPIGEAMIAQEGAGALSTEHHCKY